MHRQTDQTKHPAPGGSQNEPVSLVSQQLLAAKLIQKSECSQLHDVEFRRALQYYQKIMLMTAAMRQHLEGNLMPRGEPRQQLQAGVDCRLGRRFHRWMVLLAHGALVIGAPGVNMP